MTATRSEDKEDRLRQVRQASPLRKGTCSSDLRPTSNSFSAKHSGISEQQGCERADPTLCRLYI